MAVQYSATPGYFCVSKYGLHGCKERADHTAHHTCCCGATWANETADSDTSRNARPRRRWWRRVWPNSDAG